MQHFKIFLGAIFCLFFSMYAEAQFPDFCATESKVQEALIKYPAKKLDFQKNWEQNIQRDAIQSGNGYLAEKSHSPNYIIPVVVHIIHENGTENISDAQVLDGIRFLNADFAKRNSDTLSIVPAFQAIAADCQIEFRLAQFDPNGNCTNGIDRIYSSQTNIGDDGSKLNPWPYENYYNIWVVKNISPGGIAGYAYYPGTAPPGAEGVIILHNYFGSIGTSSTFNARVLTHETGHYLNLPHVWGSTNSPGVACGNDGVSDTPITKGWTSCNLNGAICNSGVIENVQNYMEYSYCARMFTWGQKARMTNALNSFNGSRNSLWIPSNIIATGVDNAATLCQADFTSYPNALTLCAGETISFKDISFNGKPTAWAWSFPGGTLVAPSTVNDSAPVVQYLNPGTYSVGLTVSNGSGSVSTTKASYVSVNSTTAQFGANFFVEDFETNTVPGDWLVKDLDGGGNTWTKSAAAHTSGVFSVLLNNNAAAPGDIDELISPSISVAAISSPYLSFKYAYASRFGGTGNKLIVYVSPDCGKSWYQRKGITGVALPTTASMWNNFIPGPSDWKQETVNISNMVNQSNVLIKFKFINEDGNNLFIDDINILTNLGTRANFDENNQISVYPNPLTSNSKINISLDQPVKLQLDLYNAAGQKLTTIANMDAKSGLSQIELPLQLLPQMGLYFLVVRMNENTKIVKLQRN